MKIRLDLALTLIFSVLCFGWVLGRFSVSNCVDPSNHLFESIPSSYSDEAAEWVKNRKPVPSRLLYPYSPDKSKQAPPPLEDRKPLTWYTNLLFSKQMCPYCGHRVPISTMAYVFLIIGFLGQGFFSLRFLSQWIASERAKSSVIPTSFWWLSIIGSMLSLVYGLGIWALPIMLGQLPGMFIYARNLYFIRRSRNSDSAGNH